MDRDSTQLLTETTGFDLVEQAFRSSGAEAVFESLIQKAREDRNYRMIFSVRLMQVRYKLGLPLIDPDPVPKLTDAQRPAKPAACFLLPATFPPHGRISVPLVRKLRLPPPSKRSPPRRKTSTLSSKSPTKRASIRAKVSSCSSSTAESVAPSHGSDTTAIMTAARSA